MAKKKKDDKSLDALSMGISVGAWWGLGVLLMGLLSRGTEQLAGFVDWLSQFYIGYSSTVAGSLIGAVWGFVDLGIGAFLVVWLYNKIHEYRRNRA